MKPRIDFDHVAALKTHGEAALRDAMADLMKMKRLETNTLSALGNLVSRALRRRILLNVLVDTCWNLSQTAITLRITNGAPAVTRLIADLGLVDAYTAAKKSGDVDPRGRKTPYASWPRVQTRRA